MNNKQGFRQIDVCDVEIYELINSNGQSVKIKVFGRFMWFLLENA